MKKRKKGQGILEYVVVLTAIVGVVILIAATVVRDNATVTYENAGQVIDRGNQALLGNVVVGGN